MYVTNPLINPSHGGAYMAEGRLLLGLDWLIVGLEPCLLFTFIASPCIVPVHCIVLSHVSWASGLFPFIPYRCYCCYRMMWCFIVAAYMVLRIP